MKRIGSLFVIVILLLTSCGTPEPTRRDPVDNQPGEEGTGVAGSNSLLNRSEFDKFTSTSSARVYRTDSVIYMTTDSVGILEMTDGTNHVEFVDIDTGQGIDFSFNRIESDSTIISPVLKVNGVSTKINLARLEYKTESTTWITAVDSVGAIYCIVY